jgi:hypothetical protein
MQAEELEACVKRRNENTMASRRRSNMEVENINNDLRTL